MSITTMSSKGQIVVPKEIRDRAGIDPGDKIEISLGGQTVQLRKLAEAARQPRKTKFDKETGFPIRSRFEQLELAGWKPAIRQVGNLRYKKKQCARLSQGPLNPIALPPLGP